MNKAVKGLPKIKGLGKAKSAALYQAGFTSVESIQQVSLDDLVAVKGINASLAKNIKKAAGEVKPATKKKVAKKKAPAKKRVPKKKTVKKPIKVLSDVRERLLKVRKRQKSKKPAFRRHDWHKKKRVGESWRRPRGLHNKLRSGIAAKGALVRIGYRSPKEVRGLHPSGYEEVLVHRPSDVEKVDATMQAIRVSSKVGIKKRLDIEERAEELGIKILNPMRKE
ncbi:MAG: 50S ribosomal protein L32e [Methanocellales archaeon]|nr:50S ribosomal protein L32e [Methanocellales archaeon]